MKIKIGTMLDEELLLMVKQLALSRRQPLNKLLEDALKTYLQISGKGGTSSKVVEATKGVMKLSPRLQKALENEPGLYESWTY
jgi:hypothetical protein